MRTQDAVDKYLEKCREKGLSESTIAGYSSRLKFFPIEYPELPTKTMEIESFLKRRGETPKKRGKVFDTLQGFYSYLAEILGVESPVPAKGPMGRPRKKPLSSMQNLNASIANTETLIATKVGQGGVFIIELHLFVHCGVDIPLPYRKAGQRDKD